MTAIVTVTVITTVIAGIAIVTAIVTITITTAVTIPVTAIVTVIVDVTAARTAIATITYRGHSPTPAYLFTLCFLSSFPLHALLLLVLLLLILLLILLLVLMLLLPNLPHSQVPVPLIPRPDSFAVIFIPTPPIIVATGTAPSGEGRTARTNRRLSRRIF